MVVEYGRTHRGVTLLEMVLTLLILSFVVLGAARLFDAGGKQQRLARGFSQDQTDLREALKHVTENSREGYAIVNPSANFGGSAPSNASQMIVQIPEPTGAASSKVEVRYYLSGGTLYQQRADQAAPGTALVTHVDSLAFNYFKYSIGVRTAVDSTPGTANAFLVTLTLTNEKIQAHASELVVLRNALAPF
jgi:prepilin-type N-terminal cleavage/methylation domain-containing protein